MPRKPRPAIDPATPLPAPSANTAAASRGWRPIPGVPAPPRAPEPEPPPIDWSALEQLPPIAGPAPIPGTLVRRTNELLAELAARNSESLPLFVPLPEQERFLRSRAPMRIYRGGNRAGKTIVAAVEAALAFTGTGGLHGLWPRENGLFYAVGLDLTHCGEVMHRKLFEQGAFKVIRDEHAGSWRAFRPWAEYDRAYREKARDAPPLIPERWLAGPVVWENKAAGIPSQVRFITGWRLNYYSSKANPRQGTPIDGFWFDEEIEGRDWLPEMQMRLLDRGGRGQWSATPQAGTVELVELQERADAEEELRELAEADGEVYTPAVEAFCLSLLDNPHIDESEKAKAQANLTKEGEIEVRIHGGFAASGFRIWPEFQARGKHAIEPFPIPADWTWYYTLDPGRQRCAALLFVVAPRDHDEHGGHVFGVDRIYIPKSDADKFAEELVKRRWYDRRVERHWIDNQYARQVGPAGKTNGWYYEEALRRRGLGSARTGARFEIAPPDPEEGIEAVRAWLRPLPDGRPKFQVFAGRLPELEKEMGRVSYKADPRTKLPSEKPDFQRYHLCDCLRYAALLDPKWARPKGAVELPTHAYEAAQRLKARLARQGQVADGSIRLG